MSSGKFLLILLALLFSLGLAFELLLELGFKLLAVPAPSLP
ncbi:MAG: hypothetical protein AAFW84_25850 [Cyanobacteria bacterium J06635_15]